jgi:hypothetical protein
MIISNKKKFIFIHIFKTGGMSVTDVLMPYADMSYKFSGYWPTRKIITLINLIFGLADNGNKWFNRLHKHATAFETRNLLGEDKFDEFFSFAFVRNPLDHLVSLYYYIKQSREHKYHSTVKDLNFGGFVEFYLQQTPQRQSDFVVGEKNDLIVDFIGKTETLDSDMKYICKRIGIPSFSVPRLNQSKRRPDFMSYYDQEILSKVYDYFKVDFETFGYSVE